MSTPHNDDELRSESQSQVDIPKGDDKGKQPLVEQPAPQASTSAPPTPVPPTPAPPTPETAHREECRACFQRLLRLRADPEATTLQAKNLLFLMKNLGMASAVTADGLCYMLKLSGHADENDALDFERFTIFAEDFMLMESIRAHKSTRQLQAGVDRGPLGDFFTVLGAAEEIGFMSFDFSDAFSRLDLELSHENADCLARYANLHSGVNISFEQFLKVLDEKHMQRTGEDTLRPRANALDKSHCIGRLMTFASAYTRPERATGRAATTLAPIAE